MTTKAKAKSDKYFEAVGRRKEAVARVRLSPDAKKLFLVNNKAVNVYFPTMALQSKAKKALAPELAEKFSVSAKIVGGGVSAQADALMLGIARALVVSDPAMKPALKGEGLLVRDARIKERRKFGLKKARKSPQWSKR